VVVPRFPGEPVLTPFKNLCSGLPLRGGVWLQGGQTRKKAMEKGMIKHWLRVEQHVAGMEKGAVRGTSHLFWKTFYRKTPFVTKDRKWSEQETTGVVKPLVLGRQRADTRTHGRN